MQFFSAWLCALGGFGFLVVAKGRAKISVLNNTGKIEGNKMATNSSQHDTFFDIHCHAFNMAHPALFSFLENVRKSGTGDILKEMISITDFLPSRSLSMTRRHVLNLLAVMENDVGGMFLLLEDDLAGAFRKDGGPPFLTDVLRIGEHDYERIILTPLIMDFNTPTVKADEIYYDRPPEKPLQKQINDTLDGIRHYVRERPRGKLEIYPFLGINPANYSLDEVRKLLNDYLGLHSISRHLFYKAFSALSQLDFAEKISGKGLFAGVKLYPPLGFDPWPEGQPEEMAKVHYLYDFCQKKSIPITTHCDDQGYRTIPLALSQEWTSPRHWRKVLHHYPQLKINFAHLGRQYLRKFGSRRDMEWFNEIIDLCCEYDHVYTDFSFTGSNPEFYDHLVATMNDMPTPQQDVLQKKILFGSDFMIHLLDVESYYDYIKIFHESQLSSELKHQFCSINPARFLFQK